ncbi:MAG: MarR family transcriptional regulator [Chloroflexota bacterium]
MTIDATSDPRERLVEHILELEPVMFRAMGPVEPNPWLDVDISMSQLKVLMTLAWAEPAAVAQGLRMSDLARCLGVTPATVTVVVDRLVERGLVSRQHDPLDRRLHRCVLTSEAQALLERICESARLRTRRLLLELSLAELQVVEEGMELLIRAALRNSPMDSSVG